jgi:legumain
VFRAVLTGNQTAIRGRGTGKVLHSSENDHVFMYFSDHGSPGMLSFPTEHLFADDFLAILNQLNGRYAQMMIYIEACYSGSMFVKLPENIRVYAMSAASPDEPSWATDCEPDDDLVHGKHIGTCLSDVFTKTVL